MYRHAWFKRLNDWGNAITLIGGSAVIARFTESGLVPSLIIGGLIVSITVSSLVFGWSDKAGRYESLYRRVTELLADITLAGEGITKKDMDSFRSRFHMIETDELRTMNILAVICHNEECSRQGTGGQKHLRWYQRLLSQVKDIGPYPWLKHQIK